ncbi:MAG: bacteriophage Gp15 family protein [Ruminococcus sp.]|nr:bacteriophage Gp15 family protein [Ruminococcus sp.]
MFTKRKNIIETGGVKIPVDGDFRIMCRYSAAVLRGDKEAAAECAKEFFFSGLPDGISGEKAAEIIGDFYAEGLSPGYEKKSNKDDDKAEKIGQTVQPSFDFEEDEGYFFAAFLGEYGINLNEAKMHWFDFCSLFRGLDDECKLKRIIAIRGQSTNDEKTTAGKQRLRKLKKVFGLKLNRPPTFNSLEERDNAMKNMLKRQREMLKEKMKEAGKGAM